MLLILKRPVGYTYAQPKFDVLVPERGVLKLLLIIVYGNRLGDLVEAWRLKGAEIQFIHNQPNTGRVTREGTAKSILEKGAGNQQVGVEVVHRGRTCMG